VIRINILSGVLNRKKMADFTGVESKDLDQSLNQLANIGWIRYKKMGSKYAFTLYSEPIKRELRIN
jgi:hypothetical protein